MQQIFDATPQFQTRYFIDTYCVIASLSLTDTEVSWVMHQAVNDENEKIKHINMKATAEFTYADRYFHFVIFFFIILVLWCQ